MSRLPSPLSLPVGRTLASLVITTSLFACTNADTSEDDPMEDPDDPDPDDDPDDMPDPVTSCSLSTGLGRAYVVLHDRDGAVLEVVKTGSDGLAVFADCPADSMLSLGYQEQSGGWVGATIASVQPGDDFQLGIAGLGVVGVAHIDVPEDGSELEQVRVSAGPGCSSYAAEGETESLPIATSCLGSAGQLPVLATGNLGGVIMYSQSTSALMTDEEEVVIDDMSSWMTGPAILAQADNTTDPQVDFNVEPMRGGLPYFRATFLTNTAGNQAERYLTVPPSGFSSSTRIGVATSELNQRGVVRDVVGSSAELDLAAAPGPIEEVDLDLADPERPHYSYGQVPDQSDFVIVASGWFSEEYEVQWRFIAPGTSTAIQLPELPSELASAVPVEVGLQSIRAIDVTGADYADILTRGYTLGQFWSDCPTLLDSQLCRFSSYFPQI